MVVSSTIKAATNAPKPRELEATLPVLSAAQSQLLAPVFLSIWLSEQIDPSGRSSPKKAMSPDMEAVPDMEALPTTSKLTDREAPVDWRLNL